MRCENHSAALPLLDRIATQTPHFSLHVLAATVARASGEGDLATRHMQLAARLAPSDAALGRQAEAALDTALLDQVRPFGRGGIALGGLSLLWMLGLAYGRRRDARARRKYLDGISGRMKLVVDDRAGADVGILTPRDGALVVDVFLKGRYGMRPHPVPRNGPSLHLACSSASAGRTVRITPIHDVRGDAVRVQVTPETMRRLRAHPGRWRVQATLGDRRIAIAELNVLAA